MSKKYRPNQLRAILSGEIVDTYDAAHQIEEIDEQIRRIEDEVIAGLRKRREELDTFIRRASVAHML